MDVHISRRQWLSSLRQVSAFGLSTSLAIGLPIASAFAEDDENKKQALAFTRKATDDLFNAHKLGTVKAFLPAIEKHADIASIADFSLGQYLEKMPDSMKPSYYRGVALFIARYFADQTRSYRVAKWVVGDARQVAKDSYFVATTVTLLSGASYSIGWSVKKGVSGYKFTDVKVIFFSLTSAQRSLFVNYLNKHKGDLNLLVTVLNRK